MMIAIAIAAGPTSASLFARRLMRTITSPENLGDKVSDELKA
jgi:hypothetical protein